MATRVTPTKIFVKQKIGTCLDLLKPSTEDYASHKQAEQKYHDAHVRCPCLEVGESVLALNHHDG